MQAQRSDTDSVHPPTTKARRASDAGPQVNDLTHGETARYLFAIELSWMSWVIAFNTPLSQKISRRTLIGCKWKRLLKLIEEVRARISRETGRAVEAISC
jgi:hypothetical protein